MKLILRFFGFLFAAGTILFVVGVAATAGLLWHYSKDLPDYSQLQDYEPPVMTRVHAADGSLVAEYARERRLYIPIQAVPKLVINAFLAAEDKNFYEHGGLDFFGIARAAVNYAQNFGSSRRPQGASTITQQVAKNFLLIERGFLHAQDQGGAAGAQDRAHLQQGQDPRALLERDLSRARRLRHRLGLAHLFRQGRQRTHRAGSRLSRGAAEGAEQLSPVPPARARARAAQLGDRPDGAGRLHQDRRRREGQAHGARRDAKGDQHAHLRRGIFRRGSAARALRPLRREEALRRRPVGAHHARHQAAGAGAQDAHRRPGAIRRGARLARAGQPRSTSPATGASSSPTSRRWPTWRPGGSRWCWR